MEITVKKIMGYWKVVFNHGGQYFTLDNSVETKKEAEWVKSMLAKCFESAYGKQPDQENTNCDVSDVGASAFVESCIDLTTYVQGSKIDHRFRKLTIPVIEFNELRDAAKKYDSKHLR